jgi:polyhydroxyalkanoate synthesis regulator protein
MAKAASDVMQSVLIAAVVEAIEALRTGAGGLPNNLLRDLQSVHRNANFADLPKPLQDSIAQSVRSAFNELLKEGYAVGPKGEMQSRPIDRVPERDRERRGPTERRFPRSGPGRRGPDRNGPGRGPRPGGKPKP